MNIFGISDVTGNHSHSCVAILLDGKLTFALSQERITRKKNDSIFPTEAIEAALDCTGLKLTDFDCFACSYPPADYYGSLMKRSKRDLPRSFFHAAVNRPLQMSKYLFPNIRKALFDPKGTNGLLDMGVPQEKFKFYDHHLSHVSAGYFSSNLDDCLAISYGGFAPHISGQNVAGAVYKCEGNDITFLQDIPMFASGCYFSGVTVALGFNYMQQEGKTMGLAAHGNPNICYEQVKNITTTFKDEKWNAYPFWIDYIMSPRAEVYLGTKSGKILKSLIEKNSPEDIAAAAQKIWENNIISFVRYLLKKYNKKKLVLSGGTFLNVRINRKLLDLPGVEEIYVHPHTGDGSTTIGAMIEAMRDLTGNPVRLPMEDVGLGVEYSEQQIERAIIDAGGGFSYFKNKDISNYAAQQIAKGKVIGWFQGREEYGHRSLGHRCILGDPRSMDVKNKINQQIKSRDNFIPIAPSILSEHGRHYFENFEDNPFMTRIYTVIPAQKERVIAALHVDGTARAQAVNQSSYKPFRKLLENFYDITGIPMVLNSSFNLHGNPIVHEPAEAIELFKSTAMDELVIGPFVLTKNKRGEK